MLNLRTCGVGDEQPNSENGNMHADLILARVCLERLKTPSVFLARHMIVNEFKLL